MVVIRLWLILSILVCTLSNATALVTIEKNQQSIELTNELSIFEDPTSQLTIHQVVSPAFNQKFTRLPKYNKNLGFSRSTFWLKFTIENKSDIDYWLLKNHYNAIQFLDLYELDNQQLISQIKSGALRSIEQRAYPSHHIVFPIHIRPDQQKTYYLKAQSLTPIIINLTLHSEPALMHSESIANLISGTVLGILLVLLLVNLVFYAILNFTSQLFLCLYILGMLMVYSAYDGYLLHLLPDSLAPYATLLFLSCGSLAFIGLYFYFEQLLLKKKGTVTKNLLRASTLIYWGVTNLLAYNTQMLLPYKMYIVASFIFPLIGTLYSGYAWFKKQHQARFIFIGLSCLTLAYFVQMSQLLGLIDNNVYIPIELNRIGNIILITLLSTAIVDYVRQYQALQQQSQSQIKEAEDKFKRVFEQAYQMLFLISPEGDVLSANNEAIRFLDKPKDVLDGMAFTAVFTSLRGIFDQDIMKKSIRKAIDGELVTQNIVAYSTTGTLKDLEISYQPYVKNQLEANNVLIQVRDITKQAQAFKAIQDMVVGIAGLSTENFFKKFLIEISQIYNAKYVLLSQLNDTSPQTATTVAIIKDKQPMPNFTFAIANTPSEQLIDAHLCNYPSGVQQLFSNDEWLVQHQIESYLGVNIKDSNNHTIGFLSVMDNKPLDEDNYFIEVLDVFAARIGNELRHQESQDALKKALEKLDFHITHTPLAVIEWDKEFNVTKWNKAAEKIFGFTLNHFKNKNPLDVLLPKDEVVNVRQVAKELLTNNGGRYSLNKNLTLSGKEILCEWYNTPLIDSEGQVTGVASLVNDVTAEHNALNALYLKEQEQSEVFNTLTDAIFIIDENGHILSTNHAVKTLFEYDTDELLGESAAMLLTGKYSNNYARYVSTLLSCLPKQSHPVSKEIFGCKKNGEQFQFNLSLSAMPEDNTGKKRLLATCHDLTEFKIQQETLRQSQKMDALGSLTGGIAHDFNNLLGIINGYAELLTLLGGGDKKLTQYAQHILKASKRGAKLTKKLLSFARKNIEVKELVDINHLLLDEFDMLQKTITPRINLTYLLDDDLPLSNIDKSELEDCMLNLSINAMHAITGQGEITISTVTVNFSRQQASLRKIAPGKYIKLMIKDDGKGMDEHTQQKALEPFFTTKGNAGTGLGLSQVYGFVERSKGYIDIKSSLGKGTEVSIFLPVAQGQLTAKANKQIKVHKVVENTTVLVVDDEPSLVELSTTLLTNAGYQVYSAESGQQALTVLKQHKIDALLCDIIMPNMGGVELAKIVRKQYPDVAILFVSGYYEQNSSNQAELPSDKVIKKPYDGDELIDRLAQIIVEKQQTTMI